MLAPEIRSIGEVGRHASRILGRRIRIRLFWVLVFFGIGAASTWYWREEAFGFLLVPAQGNLSPFEGNLPIFTSPTAMMGATIQLAIRGGILAALPVLTISVYTLFSFLIAPQQRRFLVLFLPATVACFLGGSAFAYYVLLPTALSFLLNFGTGVAVPVIALDEYISLLTAMVFWLGVVFELPIAMFLLARMRIVSYLRLRGFRKYVPLAAFILAAIITPTMDVLNATFLAVPMIVLYEIGLFVSWMAWPEEGDYMWFKKIGAGAAWVRRKVRSLLARTLRRVRIVVGFPVVKVRWAYRKVLRKE